jgi:hypothetical protein
MNTRSENEINSEEEMNLYDYWKVLIKRKKIFIGIFLIPLVMVTIIILSMPRYYRGECEISIPATPTPNIITVMPASNIVKLIGYIDDTKKIKIFTNTPDAIKSVFVSVPKNSTGKVSIVIDAKTADNVTAAFKDIFNYIGNLPEIKEEIARIKEEQNSKLNNLTEESNFKIKALIEAKKANLIFLNQVTDMMKKRQVPFVNINPADLIMKDSNLSLEIANLQQARKTIMAKKSKITAASPNALIAKDADLASEITNLRQTVVTFGSLGPLSITVQPSNSQIRKIIISTGALSLVAAIFIVFFLLDYIERIKARENK